MTVEVRRFLTVDVPKEEDFGAPHFDNGPGYDVVQVDRFPGLRGKLPGKLGERVILKVGESGLSLADAEALAQDQAEKYGGRWVVKESERIFY